VLAIAICRAQLTTSRDDLARTFFAIESVIDTTDIARSEDEKTTAQSN
jgi:hypothetical protein